MDGVKKRWVMSHSVAWQQSAESSLSGCNIYFIIFTQTYFTEQVCITSLTKCLKQVTILIAIKSKYT